MWTRIILIKLKAYTLPATVLQIINILVIQSSFIFLIYEPLIKIIINNNKISIHETISTMSTAGRGAYIMIFCFLSTE